MTLEMLLGQFDGLIQTPADVEKLRFGIINWAIQGRLDTQNEDDEPASTLLKKLTSTKEELEDARRSKKKRQFKPFTDEEIPHKLPKGWQWVRLPQIGLINPRNDLDDGQEVSFIPMTLVPEDYGQEVEMEIREWKEIKKGYTHFQENDIAFAKITPCFQNRKSAVLRGLVNGAGAGTTELVVLRSDVRFIVPDYVLLFFKSPRFIDTGVSKMKGTAGQQRVPKDYYLNVPFPLPPLAEQKRIVARVDELFALCDQLAGQLTTAETSREQLLDAILAQAT